MDEVPQTRRGPTTGPCRVVEVLRVVAGKPSSSSRATCSHCLSKTTVSMWSDPSTYCNGSQTLPQRGQISAALLGRVGRVVAANFDDFMLQHFHGDPVVRANIQRWFGAARAEMGFDNWIGQTLPSLFLAAGLTDIRIDTIPDKAFSGPGGDPERLWDHGSAVECRPFLLCAGVGSEVAPLEANSDFCSASPTRMRTSIALRRRESVRPKVSLGLFGPRDFDPMRVPDLCRQSLFEAVARCHFIAYRRMPAPNDRSEDFVASGGYRARAAIPRYQSSPTQAARRLSVRKWPTRARRLASANGSHSTHSGSSEQSARALNRPS